MGTVTVEIDVDDVIDQLTDKQIAAEYRSRDLGKSEGQSPRETVARSIAYIRTGRVEDGITMLQREFFPAWKDRDAAERAYREEMALKAVAQ